MGESWDSESAVAEPGGCWGRLLLRACRGLALAGGAILLCLVGLSLFSLSGRKLYASPVRGDIELLEMGAAVAIAAFLPLCELHGRHIRVETFTLALPAVARRILDAFAHGLCLFAALLLAWRTALQARDNYLYGDQSVLLGVPLWIPLALIVPSLLLLALASAWQVGRLLRERLRPPPAP
ncbi:TRAP transporter small permease [Pseudomonas stutzeri]|nr:TRAP transporter small permease [Stutzerimonas stutzeri]